MVYRFLFAGGFLALLLSVLTLSENGGFRSKTALLPRELAREQARGDLLPLTLGKPAMAQAEVSPLHPSATFYAQRQKLALRSAIPNRTRVPRYQKLELTLDLAAAYDNPFDPADILVQAEFTSPHGRTLTIDGFLDQPFTRRLAAGAEQIELAGNPVWRIRFAPDEKGTWSYRVMARDRSGTVNLPEARFRVTDSPDPGFVRRSQRNPAVFAFEDERPFFAVGENMGWAGKRGSFEYDDWLAALGESGGNWIRVWMCSWNCGLEWSGDASAQRALGDYHGLGVYSLSNAWKLDTILDTAEQNGIYVMLCFGTYGELRSGGFFNEGQWKDNPYNAANGGPCDKPEDFWTNEKARQFYKQRLRYMMARYGWRTHIHSWEFWNEANAPAAWIEEMARFLKGAGDVPGADPYHHLVTTTYGNDEIWKVPQVDFTQTHSYGTGNILDHAPVVHTDALQNAGYHKPHLVGEFGIDWRDSDTKYDPEGLGVNLHNTLWSSAFSGDAGGAMIWWWDNYIHPKKLYAPFAAFRRFVDKVPWTAGPWQPLSTEAPRQVSGPETFTNLTIPAAGGWGKSPVTDFTITSAGLAGSSILPHLLFGPAKRDLQTPLTFHLHAQHPTQFVVHVDSLSDRARLRFLLDGQETRVIDLSAAPPTDPNAKPEYEKTEYKPEWKIYQAQWNKDYAVEIPPGEHALTLENTAGDWLGMESITLTDYRSSRNADVNLYGLTQGRDAILWAENAQHNWRNVLEKKPIPVLQGVETVAHGLPAGHYNVEWWDTQKGEIIRRDRAECGAEGLVLRLPDLAADAAARIYPR